MKITHTTFDRAQKQEQAQDSVPGIRERASIASVKVRDWAAKRLSRSSDLSPQLSSRRGDDERPAMMWPRFDEPKSAVDLPEMNASLARQLHLEEERKHAARAATAARSRGGGYLPTMRPPPGRPTSSTSRPSARRAAAPKAAKLAERVKEKLKRRAVPAEGERQGETAALGGGRMSEIYTLRQAMQEGKLERVVPPLQARAPIGTVRGRRAPPPPFPEWQPLSIRPRADVQLTDNGGGLHVRSHRHQSQDCSRPGVRGGADATAKMARGAGLEEEAPGAAEEGVDVTSSPGRRVFRRWSATFGATEVPVAVEGEVEGEDEESGQRRHSAFYAFWDEVLRDHGHDHGLLGRGGEGRAE